MQASKTSSVITAAFLLERETKGAVRYQEVDDKDQPVEMISAKIGTLYIRKTAFEAGGELPKRLIVTVEGQSDDSSAAPTPSSCANIKTGFGSQRFPMPCQWLQSCSKPFAATPVAATHR